MKEAFTGMALMHGFASYATTCIPKRNARLNELYRNQSNSVKQLGQDKHSMHSAVQVHQIAD